MITQPFSPSYVAGAYDSADIAGLSRADYVQKHKEMGINLFSWSTEVLFKLSTSKIFELLEKTLLAAAAQVSDVEFTVNWVMYQHGNTEIYMRPTEGSSGVPDAGRVYLRCQKGDDDEGVMLGAGQELAEDMILRGTVEFVGNQKLGVEFKKRLEQNLAKREHDNTVLIKWLYSKDRYEERVFPLKKTWEIDAVYYPWITEQVNSLSEYYTAFMESDAQILILFGPPGTGKTSFIRDLACEMNLNLIITYDVKQLTSDSTFVDYLADQRFNGIVIEDADELLTVARGDMNKVIAKILNISDGLIKLPRKKMIFTTNLTKTSDIDPAITRPGRCFDVLEFRPLDRVEAQAVAGHLNVQLPDDAKAKTFTLAEVFAQLETNKSGDPFSRRNRKKLDRPMGFI